MDFGQIRRILNNRQTRANLYFTRKTREGYFSYSPEVEPEILQQLINHASEYLDIFAELDQIEFSPIGYRDGTIEICGCDYVGNFDEVYNSFDEGNIENIDEQVENLAFYCISIEDEEGSIQLFRRVTKFKRLYSKGLLAAFQGGRLNKIDGRMLGLDGNIDLVVFNGEIAILSHIALERIFKLQEQYSAKATEAINCIRETNKILNFDDFENDCLNDQKIQKVLAKMLRESDNLQVCFDNFDNIIETINIFELDIEVQYAPTEGIVYEDKRQLMDILRLARDSYYRSLIREQTGIDDKI